MAGARILTTSLEQRRLREENADLRAQLREVAEWFGSQRPVKFMGMMHADLAALIDRANFGEGYVFGGVHLDGSYLTGGLVGYDSVHPQQLGYAILAKYLVDFLNETYDSDIEPFNLSEILFDNPCAPLTPPPYGVDAKSVQFSPEAADSFLELFMPELPRVLPHDQEAAAATD